MKSNIGLLLFSFLLSAGTTVVDNEAKEINHKIEINRLLDNNKKIKRKLVDSLESVKKYKIDSIEKINQKYLGFKLDSIQNINRKLKHNKPNVTIFGVYLKDTCNNDSTYLSFQGFTPKQNHIFGISITGTNKNIKHNTVINVKDSVSVNVK